MTGRRRRRHPSRSLRKAGTISALIGLVLVVIALRADPSSERLPGPGAPVRLEPAGVPGSDSFTDSAVDPRAPSQSPSSPDSTPGSRGRLSGSSKSLYAGARDVPICDVRKLVGSIQKAPATERAWAGAAGIGTNDIPHYVASLTSALLRVDARVTEFTLKQNKSVEKQSVLQAGTAVLVDRRGMPRVRCISGNPLGRPGAGPLRYQGATWPGFDPSKVREITPSNTPLSVIHMLDVRTSAAFVRIPGSISVLDLNPPPAGATVTVVEPGHQTTLKGEQWPPNTPLRLNFGNPAVTLATPSTDTEGKFTARVKIPEQARPGAQALTITGGGLTVNQAAYVTPRSVRSSRR